MVCNLVGILDLCGAVGGDPILQAAQAKAKAQPQEDWLRPQTIRARLPHPNQLMSTGSGFSSNGVAVVLATVTSISTFWPLPPTVSGARINLVLSIRTCYVKPECGCSQATDVITCLKVWTVGYLMDNKASHQELLGRRFGGYPPFCWIVKSNQKRKQLPFWGRHVSLKISEKGFSPLWLACNAGLRWPAINPAICPATK